MVTIFNDYKLLQPISVACFDFRGNRSDIMMAICLAMLYSGLVVSTLWMNLVHRAALRSSRVVRSVVERASS